MLEREPLRPLSDSQREALEEAVKSYQGAHTAASARWLLGRGITREDAATFRLGVVGTKPFPGHSKFVGWLAIPYLGKDGQPLSLRFRCMENHEHRDHYHGKYMSMTDEPSRVYNVAAIHDAEDEINVTEGEFDTMILSKVVGPSIAIPGASAWSNHHRRMLAGFSRINVWGDPDDAGAEFVQRVTRACRNARGIRLYDGDVSDTYNKGGAEAVKALLPVERSAA